jgi:hypothetical protein
MTGEKIIEMAQKAVYEKRKGWRLIEERLAQLGYIGAQASQFSPATGGTEVETCLEGDPTVATNEHLRCSNYCKQFTDCRT